MGGTVHPRAALPALSLVLGAMTLAVGTGLGVRPLVVQGLAGQALLGLTLLVLGLGATLWGAVGLLRGVRRRWWFLAVPAGLLFVATLLGTLGVAVMADFPPRPPLGSSTPGDLDLEFDDVTFSAADGVRLSGWYVPSRNGAAVVLLHGAGSTRSAVLEHAGVLARAGYGVLLYDARGHGRSSGRGMDFGWWGESDLRGAVDLVLDQPDVTGHRVAIVGLSMGGEQAIGAAGADPRVGAVVAEGATNRVWADKAYLDEYGWRGSVQRGIDWLTYGATGLLTRAPEPESLRRSVAAAARRSEPPRFLLITAGRVADEGYAAQRLRAAAPALVQIWTVPGAGHIAGLKVARSQWEDRVLGFLDEALSPAAG